MPGEPILCVNDVYGGTFRYFERVLRDMGVATNYDDSPATRSAALDEVLDATTRLVWLETPTNPHLRVIDIAAIAGRLATHPGARRAADPGRRQHVRLAARAAAVGARR